MNDHELSQKWASLEPTALQRRRIDRRVSGWLEAWDSSLAAEWRDLLSVNWLEGLGYAAVAASLLLIATPFSWLARSLL